MRPRISWKWRFWIMFFLLVLCSLLLSAWDKFRIVWVI